MAFILSIDTATKVCSVAIHEDGKLVGQQAYHLQKSHSSLLPEIIKQLLENSGLVMADLNAVAISEGPGSYTGLRIGTATAKGLAFSVGLPLIAVDSLDSMLAQVINHHYKAPVLFCPMIDARRMEVYCKLVDKHGNELWETKPVVIDHDTFDEFSDTDLVLFGNGSDKLKEFFTSDKFVYVDDIDPNASFMGELAFRKYEKQDFVDLAYFEPEYLKEFRTNVPSQKFKQ